jgi:hypothetical protein
LNVETYHRELQSLLQLRRLNKALKETGRMNVFAEITDRNQIGTVMVDFEAERDRRLLKHHLIKRCAALPIMPDTFAMAYQLACNARHAGADQEQALQAGVRYAERHQLRSSPQPPEAA